MNKDDTQYEKLKIMKILCGIGAVSIPYINTPCFILWPTSFGEEKIFDFSKPDSMPNTAALKHEKDLSETKPRKILIQI